MRLLYSIALLAALAASQPQWRVERSRLATILFGVSFINQDYGIVTGGANGAGSAIFLTRDGGNTYNSLPAEGQPPPGVSIFLNAHLGNPTSAVAAGLCSWCFVASGIEYSTDGQRFRLANDPAQGFPPVAAVQGGAVVPGSRIPHYGFIGMWGLLDNGEGEDIGVRHSLDGGITWIRVPVPYREAGCRYMSMPSSSIWYVSCGTWPRAQKNTDSMRSISEKVSLAASNTTGFSWVFNDVQPVTEGKSGYRTAILKTIDSGRNWQVVFELLDGDYYLNNLDCLSTEVCYVVGDGQRGVGLHTADGGRNWREMAIPLPGGSATTMMDIRFVSAREGFIAGGIFNQAFQGVMLHTTNAGATWAPQNVNGVIPVSLSLYLNRDGTTGGHGVGLTPDGQSSTIKYH